MSSPRGLRKGRTSQSVKAGLVFPVSRVKRNVKKKTRLRVSQTFPVYFAGVLEYLCAEILELAGNAAKNYNRKRITPRHIFLAVANDEELHKMLKTVIIPRGGVMPNIHVELLQKAKQKKLPPTARECDLPSPYLFESPPRSKKARKEDLLWKPNPKKAKLKSLPPIPSPPPSPEEDEESSCENQSDIPGVDVLLQKELFNGPKITFVKGDFQNLSVDVIVNPTDADFSMEGKIGQILEEAGGKEFSQSIEELKLENGPLGCLDAVISAAINAFAKYVIHCRGLESLDESASVKLEELVEKCLNLADSRYFKSVAFPIVGLSGLPESLSAEILLNTVVNYFLSVMCTSITQLYFIVHDPEVVKRILDEIKYI